MIIVRITGGLGNQMFQYALICALKKRYPNQVIKIDVTDYDFVYAHTGYSLEKYFDIQLQQATPDEIGRLRLLPISLSRMELFSGFRKHIAKIQYKLALHKRRYLQTFNITDYIFNLYNDEVFQLDEESDWYLSGYWQNTAYFRDIVEEIPMLFPFRRQLRETDLHIIEKIETSEAVSVHVRRGDYVDTHFDLCGKEYYLRAKEIIEEHVVDPTYIFFSDDPEYVKKNFYEFEKKIVINHGVDDCDLDLNLMTRCKHAINANSSFSFWGARLRKKPGVIVTPMYAMKKDFKWYLMPSEETWIRINNKIMKKEI